MSNKPSYILIDGDMKRLSDALREYDMDKHVYLERIKMGWSVKRALTQRVRKYKKRAK